MVSSWFNTPPLQPQNRCCASFCEPCGGKGCSSQSGGAGSCCANAITNADEFCSAEKDAPCLLGGPTPAPSAASSGDCGCRYTLSSKRLASPRKLFSAAYSNVVVEQAVCCLPEIEIPAARSGHFELCPCVDEGHLVRCCIGGR